MGSISCENMQPIFWTFEFNWRNLKQLIFYFQLRDHLSLPPTHTISIPTPASAHFHRRKHKHRHLMWFIMTYFDVLNLLPCLARLRESPAATFLVCRIALSEEGVGQCTYKHCPIYWHRQCGKYDTCNQYDQRLYDPRLCERNTLFFQMLPMWDPGCWIEGFQIVSGDFMLPIIIVFFAGILEISENPVF